MPIQHFELLNRVLRCAGVLNPIYRRQVTECLSVKNLKILSNPMNHPDRFDLPYSIGGGLPAEHLRYIKSLLLDSFGLSKDYPWEKKTKGRRLYLARRKTHLRGLDNAQEIERVLEKFGFESIDFANLDIKTQARYIRESSVIVGATGAAFSNLMFIHPGTEVIGLVAEHNRQYCIYSNIVALFGGNFRYVLGSTPLPDPRTAIARSTHMLISKFLQTASRRFLRKCSTQQPNRSLLGCIWFAFSEQSIGNSARFAT